MDSMILPSTQILQSHYTKVVNKLGFCFSKETSIQILYSTEKNVGNKIKNKKKDGKGYRNECH